MLCSFALYPPPQTPSTLFPLNSRSKKKYCTAVYKNLQVNEMTFCNLTLLNVLVLENIFIHIGLVWDL